MGIAPHDLVLQLRGLADPAIRLGFLRDTLKGSEPESLAMLLGYLVSNAVQEDVRVAWLDVIRILLAGDSPLVEPVASVVTSRLQSHPARAVLAFLRTDPAVRQAPEARGEPYALQDVALGLRKARARQRSRDTLRVLTADPDPAVIRILLQNPLVGEVEAIRVAARRPQGIATFGEVLASVRFGARESVQAAMALNPWCSNRQSLAILPLLSLHHLGEVAESATLHGDVRRAAAALPALRW